MVDLEIRPRTGAVAGGVERTGVAGADGGAVIGRTIEKGAVADHNIVLPKDAHITVVIGGVALNPVEGAEAGYLNSV